MGQRADSTATNWDTDLTRTSKGLLVNGRADVHGKRYRPTWSRLAQSPGFGDLASICQAALPGAPQDTSHEHGDACTSCTLAHHAPALGGAALPAVAELAYAPPVPDAHAPVRTSVPQARAPSARAPPFLA